MSHVDPVTFWILRHIVSNLRRASVNDPNEATHLKKQTNSIITFSLNMEHDPFPFLISVSFLFKSSKVNEK